MKQIFSNQYLMLMGYMLLATLFLTGCVPESPPVNDMIEPKPIGYISDSTDQQGGQLPENVVRKASEIHEGSMLPSQSQMNAQKSAVEVETQTSIQATTIVSDTASGITMILGPVNAQRVINEEEVSSDAGQSIREVISQVLTSSSDITLFDAPEERLVDDSPRPDLARKGVKFVIKGVASTSRDSGETTVFLRAVNTMTGKVAMVASARDKSRNQAAEQTARNLLQKITGAQ